MKKLTAQEFRDVFIKNGIITENATLAGDYKLNNKAYNVLIKLFKIYEKDIDLAKEVLEPLIISKNLKEINMHTQIVAATHCLVLKIYVKQSLEILETIAQTECFYSFTAQTLLKQWHKGELSIYKKK